MMQANMQKKRGSQKRKGEEEDGGENGKRLKEQKEESIESKKDYRI